MFPQPALRRRCSLSPRLRSGPGRRREARTSAAHATTRCTREHRQFDFCWLGEWTVRDASGKVVGENRINSRTRAASSNS